MNNNFFEIRSDTSFLKMKSQLKINKVYSESYDWLASSVEFEIGNFKGNYETNINSYNFHDFYNELKIVHRTLQGVANFKTLEGQIEFKITGNGRGQMKVEGLCVDGDNEFKFCFISDQTFIQKTLKQLSTILVR